MAYRLARTQLRSSTLPWPRRTFGSRVPARTASFTAVPRAAFRAFRATAIAGGVGAGALAYANNKVEGFKAAATDKLDQVKEWGHSAYATASTTIADAYTGASAVADGAAQELSGRAQGATLWTSNKLQSFRDWFNSGAAEQDDEGSEYYEEYEDPSKPPKQPLGPALALAAAPALLPPSSDDPSNDLMLLTRKLIEIRSILLSIDHDDGLRLPSIVVIGSQSSGKSSVLEAIVGHEFLPKGNNMVTRRPIELTLVHTPPSSSDPNPIDHAEFLGEHQSGQLTDFSQVQSRLTELNLAVPAAEAVSPKPIQLKISSPRVPDLSLVDLPGYIQLASLDQPEELKDKIASLCDTYIRQNNVILAVCAADVDLANSPALRASRKVDPLGLRTIGVVTKMDLVPPEQGAEVLKNERYPLALGYVGVVCKAPRDTSGRALFHFGSRDNNEDLVGPVTRHERDFFGQHAELFNRPGMLVGTNTLKKRLMDVLEESMSASLTSISDKVSNELDEASYQFKVQYNDRRISAESYVAETMDALKSKVLDLSRLFGKPQARAMLRQEIDMLVLDTLAAVYWTDAKLSDLTKLASDYKAAPSSKELEPYWHRKLEASASAVTKSGIGRMSTHLLVEQIKEHMRRIASEEPFVNHTNASERIKALTDAILQERYSLTAEQVENSVKPLKREVEVEEGQWETGRQHSITLLEEDLRQCEANWKRIQETVGSRKLKNASAFIKDYEEKERRRLARKFENGGEATEEDDADPNRPVYNPNLLVKAREAIFLSDRAETLKARIQALKSKRCKTGNHSENAPFCPEVLLSALASQLTYTAIQHINMELIGEFFYQFPREIDSRYHLDQADILRFARENPAVRKHLDLQDRKEWVQQPTSLDTLDALCRKLELVREKLDSLIKLQNEKQGIRHQTTRRGLFGLF